ncbi:aldolase/citrate lyase family protein [Mucilaginibacter sp.]|uniref:HpcH/HpaI aldolase family protein n=1 Tax=Mucilaginibacter sp. TaxID=1882438 RepID=UPI002609ABD4|nr:aldolase/citrate lyase family protein [Mucilaginibacter sp.]MDB4926308.1 aldolase [Mucilaginibacter sp.]
MDSKEWLNSKERLIGPFLRTPRPEIVEMLAMAGYDFAVVDLEHGGLMNQSDLYPLILAAENRNIKLIARIPGIQESYIKWLSDMGIGGFQIPHIKTAEDAKKAIEYAKFYPEGDRGLCRFVRAAEFSNIPKDTYINTANSKALIILQIEGVEGAGNIKKILSVGGINVIFIGPYDLSQSLGLTGQIWHPTVIEKITEILAACNEANVATGVFTDTPEGVKYWGEKGVKYINYRIDSEMILSGFKKNKQDIQKFL